MPTQTPEQIISEEEVIRVHGNANFGTLLPRDVIANALLKYAVGYSTGYTAASICEDHGLVSNSRVVVPVLTKRGGTI